jgi:hypothetical protein
MLRYLCNMHPQMAVTHEFASLLFMRQPYAEYAQNMRERAGSIGARWGFLETYGDSQDTRTENEAFTERFLQLLGEIEQGPITGTAVQQTMQQLFPQAVVVGDKLPQYSAGLGKITKDPALNCVVIYRDCRDVAASYLHKVRTEWAGFTWAEKFNTAEKVAHRWVERMEMMEQYADNLFAMRYETLVQEPAATLAAFADWIGVDPAGFPANRVKSSSVGNYKKGLTKTEVADVMRTAGEKMAQYGYV